MDTSETYIKMCEKASQLREDFAIPKYGVFALYVNGGWIGEIYEGDTANLPNDINGFIPLYRQDQLRDILDEPLRSREAFGMVVIGSYERFYLHLIMEEKYNKVWNGEDWVNSHQP